MALYIEGKADIGYDCLLNQDYIIAETLNEDRTFPNDYLLGVIDGNGATIYGDQDTNKIIQPSKIVANTIKEILRKAYNKHKNTFLADPYPFLEMALIAANTAVGAAKLINEELYGAFSAACTFIFIHDNVMTGIHCGNTRAYILKEDKEKKPQLLQVSKDHTEAQDLLDAGKLEKSDFYNCPGVFTLTSSLGIFSNPKFQRINLPLKDDQLLLLSTDGLHYALSSEEILRHILTNKTTEEALLALTKRVIEVKHADNIGIIIAFPVDDKVFEENREKNNYYKEAAND